MIYAYLNLVCDSISYDFHNKFESNVNVIQSSQVKVINKFLFIFYVVRKKLRNSTSSKIYLISLFTFSFLVYISILLNISKK